MSERPPTRRGYLDRRLGLSGGDPAAAVSLPPVVSWLIGAMVLIFLVQALGPNRFGVWLDVALGFIPLRLGLALGEEHSVVDAVVPLIGHIFLHGNIPHLVFNMLWLAVFGAGVARRLGVEEGRRSDRVVNTAVFLGFFLACGIMGALFFYVLQPQSTVLLVGASGAISGLMGGAMRFALRRLAPWGVGQGGLAPLTARPVVLASLFYIGFNLLTALGFDPAAMDIAWEAHIGGYLAGLVLFPLFDGLARHPRPAGSTPWR